MSTSQDQFYQERSSHWDKVAKKLEKWNGWGGYYQKRISQVYQFNIPQGQKVLEIGCGSGNLLASLKPSYGLGLDISEKMVSHAQNLHPELNFQQIIAIDGDITRQFDFVVLSDTINDLWDVQEIFEVIHKLLKPDGRLILNFYSRLWEFPLKVATALNVAKPTLLQNWLTLEDTSNLLNLAGLEVVRHWEEVLLPLPIPLLATFCNKFLVRFWPFRYLAMTHFMVARLKHSSDPSAHKRYSTSIIVPARNEEGNIKQVFERMPTFGKTTEIIFVEGNSNDNTAAEIDKQIQAHPQQKALHLKQTGKGKGDAVRLGFSKAKGDVLIILDADLTMPPENLPRFYDALVSGAGDFVNGVRLVYPMEKQAMRFFNLLGNKAFTLIFSYLIGQPIKDTLCGTKVLWRKDYKKIAKNRQYFGDFDPFGDYDLIFGAAKLNLKIVDMPIRYRERTYGTTNIRRWSHGWLLLRMVLFAARRLKFI
ncbi:MAG: glycosyltransferase [Pelolinea sp.]|nr:glycosyltransferase [Pelolinea sp.]